MMEVENYDNEAVRNQLGEVLDQFSETLDQPLPDLPDQNFTRLDQLMRGYRIQEWRLLIGDCDHLRTNLPSYPILEIVADCEDFIARLKSLAKEVNNADTITCIVVMMHVSISTCSLRILCLMLSSGCCLTTSVLLAHESLLMSSCTAQ